MTGRPGRTDTLGRAGKPLHGDAIEVLRRGATSLGLRLSPFQTDAFSRYAALLQHWGSRLNLTALQTPSEIVRLHFLDSLACLQADVFPSNGSLLDVGTGAGFPGIPLKIVRPDLRLTLLDASRRKAAFLDQVIQELGLEAEVVHGRAEALGHDAAHREAFDRVAARATAPLPILLEWCLPFVSMGGKAIFPKGPGVFREVDRSSTALRALGGLLEHIHEVHLPEVTAGTRFVAVVGKVSSTPDRFPRSAAVIRKRPLD